MKAIAISVFGLFPALLAYGMPSVGDDATYDTTVTSASGQLSYYTEEGKLTAFDQTSDQYTFHQVLTDSSDSTTSSDSEMSAKQLFSDSQVADYLQNCAGHGGSLEQVVVPAGSFNSCKVSSQNAQQGTTWIGNVVFGAVKQTFIDQKGSQYVRELKSQASEN